MADPEKNTPSQTSPGRQANWLSLGRASRMLGVSEATLRHWADNGDVRAFRTPGGHRRFAEEDLVGLIQRGASVSSVRSETRLADIALGRIRQRLNRSKGSTNGWHQGLDAASRNKLRPMGRQLMVLALDYVNQSRGRSIRLDEAKAVARQHGVELAQNGMPVQRTVQGFVFFRESLGDVLKKVLPQRPYSQEQTLEKVRLLEVFMDEVLMAVVAAYDEVSRESDGAATRRAWTGGSARRVSGTYAARREI